jgi:branched-chain amino acid transport system substrate-binding protein
VRHKTKGKSHTKLLLLAALAAGMVFVSAGCTTYNSFRQTYISKPETSSDPTLTIGVIEPQTGRYADKGKAELKGIELANSIYNNVDGYKVQLVKVDTQSSVSATSTAIQGLVDMKPVAIIGPEGDASALAVTECIEEAGIPTITPSATNPLITQDGKYYFRACMTESQMGEGLAEYACNKLGSSKIGVISIKNDTSTSALLDGFDDKIRKLRGKKSRAVAAVSEIQPNEDEMKKALSKMKKSGVDVCFISMGTEEMDTFFSLAEKMKMDKVTYLGTRSWGDSSFITMMKKHPGIKVVFPYESVLTKTEDTSDTVTEEAQRFQIEYANRYGVDDIPTNNAALGYDSYLLIINAIHNSKSLKGADIRDAIRRLDNLKCATGAFSFDDSGNVVRAVTLSTIKNGKPVTEYVTKSEAEAKKLEDIESAAGNAEGGSGTVQNQAGGEVTRASDKED